MSKQSLSRSSGWALAVSGILFALFFVLHPGGGDPPAALTVLNSPYALEHTLGVGAMVLMLLGLAGFYAGHSTEAGKAGFIAFMLAFIGTALLTGVLFFDAYIVPIIALGAPALLAETGPFNNMPGLLVLAVPGTIWMFGLVFLGIVVIRSHLGPPLAGFLLIAGSFITNLPPQPVGPVPLEVIAAGAVMTGGAFAWLGLAFAMDWTTQRRKLEFTKA